MRLATVDDGVGPRVAVVQGDRFLKLKYGETGFGPLRDIATSGTEGLRRIRAWVEGQPDDAYRPLHGVELAPAIADPGAIFTIGLNYRSPSDTSARGPERPLVFGKARNSVAGHGATLSWNRAVTPNVDAEVELGVVIGQPAWEVPIEDAMRYVFGYTIVNDVSSRDEWLDGDQWLLGKSMPGFCPVGPVIVTADEFEPADVRLGCTVNGTAIQDGRTSDMRFSIAEVISYLSRYVRLEPGDLVASGTPARLTTPPGPARRLRGGDTVTAWIEGIGELTTHIA